MEKWPLGAACFPLTCVRLSGAEILAAEGGRGDGGFQDVAQVQQLKRGAPLSVEPLHYCSTLSVAESETQGCGE